MASFMPRPLYLQGKNSRYTLDTKLGGPQSRSGRGDEENSLTLPGIEPRSSIPYSSQYTDRAIPAEEDRK